MRFRFLRRFRYRDHQMRAKRRDRSHYWTISAGIPELSTSVAPFYTILFAPPVTAGSARRCAPWSDRLRENRWVCRSRTRSAPTPKSRTGLFSFSDTSGSSIERQAQASVPAIKDGHNEPVSPTMDKTNTGQEFMSARRLAVHLHRVLRLAAWLACAAAAPMARALESLAEARPHPPHHALSKEPAFAVWNLFSTADRAIVSVWSRPLECNLRPE
jgi:hypothetical protein